MEYQKIINLLENTPNQLNKFRTKRWVEVKVEHVELTTLIVKLNLKLILRSGLCDYSDTYTVVSLTITVSNTAATGAPANNRKIIVIKNCAPFTNCISEINNTQINNAKDIDIAMPMYNLIEYSNNYFETSGSSWHYYRDESFLDNAAITDFSANNNNSAKGLELEK